MAERTTKDRILDAAEQLFASQGFGGTSLRAVIKEAGVNTAAVHYHFGSKEALEEAVLLRRATPINEERLRLLGDLEAKSPAGPLSLAGVVEAFVAPVMRSGQGTDSGPDILRRLIGCAITEPDASIREIVHRVFGEVRLRFSHAFVRALPGLTQDEVHMRMHFMLGALALGLAFRTIQADTGAGSGRPTDPDLLLRHLVEFITAGMSGEPAASSKTAPERS